MIKLEIHILDAQLDIEIKKEANQHTLLIILSKTDSYKENGRVWNAATTNNAAIHEIARLIRESYKKPSVPKYITIADGMQVNINLKEEKSEIQFSILNNFDEGSNEYQFMQNTFDLINEIIPDDALKRYSAVFWGWAS